MPPEDLVFVDETGASTTLTRRYGYAPAGQRVVEAVPQGHWKVVTFVGALTVGGLIAPFAQAEPLTGEVFAAWVAQILVPKLRRGMVVMCSSWAMVSAGAGQGSCARMNLAMRGAISERKREPLKMP